MISKVWFAPFMLDGKGKVAHWALMAARTARSAKARPTVPAPVCSTFASRIVPLASVVICSRADCLSKSSAAVSPVQHSRMRSPIAPRAAALRAAFSAPVGEPPPGAPPRGGLLAARGASVCARAARRRSSVLSSALLSGAAFFVGLGWLVVLLLAGPGFGVGGAGRAAGGAGGATAGGDGTAGVLGVARDGDAEGVWLGGCGEGGAGA